MAGDWLKMEKDTPDKPELYRIAEILGISRCEAFLACFRLWSWADSQSEDGVIYASDSAVDDNARVPRFSHALREVGWLKPRSKGSVEFPNFVRHMGQSAKRRCVDSVRKMSARKADILRTREEKRREENKNTPLPPNLDIPEFLAAWELWLNHRREIRKPLKPTTMAAQLKELSGWGSVRAVAALRHSIAKGWTGIFEPSTNGPRAPPEKSSQSPEEKKARREQQREQLRERAAYDAAERKVGDGDRRPFANP